MFGVAINLTERLRKSWSNEAAVYKSGQNMTQPHHVMQHAISVEALQYLEGETDAKGRRLEVLKMPCPPPLYITEEEAAGVAEVNGSKPRQVGLGQAPRLHRGSVLSIRLCLCDAPCGDPVAQPSSEPT